MEQYPRIISAHTGVPAVNTRPADPATTQSATANNSNAIRPSRSHRREAISMPTPRCHWREASSMPTPCCHRREPAQSQCHVPISARPARCQRHVNLGARPAQYQRHVNLSPSSSKEPRHDTLSHSAHFNPHAHSTSSLNLHIDFRIDADPSAPYSPAHYTKYPPWALNVVVRLYL